MKDSLSNEMKMLVTIGMLCFIASLTAAQPKATPSTEDATMDPGLNTGNENAPERTSRAADNEREREPAGPFSELWREYAARGNPLHALYREAFAEPLSEEQLRRITGIPSGEGFAANRQAKRFYGYGDRAVHLSYLATEPELGFSGREDLVSAVITIDADGAWAPVGGRSAKTSGAALETRKVSGQTVTVFRLPTRWHFSHEPLPDQAPDATDPRRHPDHEDSEWSRIRTDLGIGWDKQGYASAGIGWYRLTVEVPDALSGEHSYLFFPGVDEEAWVYLDGELVHEQSRQSTGLTPADLWNTPFAPEVSGRLNAGRPHQITVRVRNSGKMGGIYLPVYLISSEQPLSLSRLETVADVENPWTEAGDPNTNRFVLARVLEAIHRLQDLPVGRKAWERWKEPLRRAVELQYRAYELEEPGLLAWDYGARVAGRYYNADAGYMFGMALAGEPFDAPRYRAAARSMMRRLQEHLLPDGAFHYITRQNETPRYHLADVFFTGAYRRVSDDDLAARVLGNTGRYYGLSCSAQAVPEFWSSPYWKQHWGKQFGAPIAPQGLIVAHHYTGNAWDAHLRDVSLARTDPKALFDDARTKGEFPTSSWVTSAEHWRPAENRAFLPERYLLEDRNILGLRGREGDWYYGATLRPRARNTFVGGIVSRVGHEPALSGALRGVQLHVESPGGEDYWLSGAEVDSSIAQDGDREAAVALRYTPTERFFPQEADDALSQFPGSVTQAWHLAGDGLTGLIKVRAEQSAKAERIRLRVLLGPDEIEKIGADRFASGPLRVRTLRSPGRVELDHWQTPGDTSNWPSLELVADPGPGGLAVGESVTFAVWIGPNGGEPPVAWKLIGDVEGVTGWRADWADGRRRAVIFNESQRALDLDLSPGESLLPGELWSLWSSGARWNNHSAKAISIEAGACALLTSDSGRGELSANTFGGHDY